MESLVFDSGRATVKRSLGGSLLLVALDAPLTDIRHQRKGLRVPEMLQRPEQSVVIPPSEIDGESSAALARAIFETSSTDVLALDLSSVTFCDSSGLAVLLQGDKYLTAGGGALILRNPPAVILRLLVIAGLIDKFTIEGAAEGQPGASRP